MAKMDDIVLMSVFYTYPSAYCDYGSAFILHNNTSEIREIAADELRRSELH